MRVGDASKIMIVSDCCAAMVITLENCVVQICWFHWEEFNGEGKEIISLDIIITVDCLGSSTAWIANWVEICCRERLGMLQLPKWVSWSHGNENKLHNWLNFQTFWWCFEALKRGIKGEVNADPIRLHWPTTLPSHWLPFLIVLNVWLRFLFDQTTAFRLNLLGQMLLLWPSPPPSACISLFIEPQ